MAHGNRPRLTYLAGLLSVAVAAAGCSSEAPQSDAQDNGAFVLYVLGLATPHTTDEINAAWSRTYGGELADCLHDAGFAWFQAPDWNSVVLPATDQLTPDFAASYGFGLSDETWRDASLQAATNDPNMDEIEALDDSERAAFDAARDGECETKASNAADQASPHISDAGVLKRTFDGERDADPQLAELREQWRSCLSGKGFEITEGDIYQLRDSLRSDFAQVDHADQAAVDQFHQREVPVAQAAVGCWTSVADEYNARLSEIATSVAEQVVSERT